MKEERDIHLIGAPLGFAGGQAGAELGPYAARLAGLHRAIEGLGLTCVDRGDVSMPEPTGQIGHPLKWPRPELPEGEPKAWFAAEVAQACANLRDSVRTSADEAALPLIVGGDHATAMGTVAGLSDHYHAKGEKIGLIWFDAHSDMNTPESSPSGNIHGMPLATILGRGLDKLTKLSQRFPMVDPENAVLVGIRDVDDRERAEIRRAGLQVFSMRELDMLGMDQVMTRAMERASKGTAGFHLSFDMDGCDPIDAPGVGTPVRGGVTHREAHLLMEHAAELGKLLGLEITEINPMLDFGNRTADFAVGLILSALGKRIF